MFCFVPLMLARDYIRLGLITVVYNLVMILSSSRSSMQLCLRYDISYQSYQPYE